MVRKKRKAETEERNSYKIISRKCTLRGIFKTTLSTSVKNEVTNIINVRVSDATTALSIASRILNVAISEYMVDEQYPPGSRGQPFMIQCTNDYLKSRGPLEFCSANLRNWLRAMFTNDPGHARRPVGHLIQSYIRRFVEPNANIFPNIRNNGDLVNYLLVDLETSIQNHFSKNLNKKLFAYFRYLIGYLAYEGTGYKTIRDISKKILYKDNKNIPKNKYARWLSDEAYNSIQSILRRLLYIDSENRWLSLSKRTIGREWHRYTFIFYSVQQVSFEDENFYLVEPRTRAARVQNPLSDGKLARKEAYRAKLEVRDSYDYIISALDWMGRHPGDYYNADDYDPNLVVNPLELTNRRPMITSFTVFPIFSMESKFVTIDSNAISDILRRSMPSRNIQNSRLNWLEYFNLRKYMNQSDIFHYSIKTDGYSASIAVRKIVDAESSVEDEDEDENGDTITKPVFSAVTNPIFVGVDPGVNDVVYACM